MLAQNSISPLQIVNRPNFSNYFSKLKNKIFYLISENFCSHYWVWNKNNLLHSVPAEFIIRSQNISKLEPDIPHVKSNRYWLLLSIELVPFYVRSKCYPISVHLSTFFRTHVLAATKTCIFQNHNIGLLLNYIGGLLSTTSSSFSFNKLWTKLW